MRSPLRAASVRLSVLVTLILVLLSRAAVGFSQTPSTTGLPPFSTFDSDTFGSVNLSNLNVHFEVPLRSTPGRGLPFKSQLILDANRIGPPISLSTLTPPQTGIGWSSTGYNNVNGNWGVTGITGGQITFTPSQQYCHYSNGDSFQFTVYSNFSYRDSHGTSHPFDPGIQAATNPQFGTPPYQPCPTFSGNPNSGSNTFLSMDGSQYLLNITIGSNGPSWYAYDANTGVINETIDPNGNSTVYTGGTPSIVKDSSVNPVMTLSYTSAGATFSYTGPSGTTQEIVTTLVPLTETLNTGCSNITNESHTPSTWMVVSKITYPDQTFYSFTYDSLGRPNVVTLPTGGQITYTYPTQNQGISCEDGGISGFTKTTPDGTWTYSRSFNSNTNLWTTTVTDPQSNVTVYTFGGTPASIYDEATISSEYEIKRVVYQGSSTVLKTIITCYNGNLNNCATTSTPTGSIANGDNAPYIKDVYTYLPGMTAPSLSELHYQIGALSEDKEYDFGVPTPPTAPGNGYVSDRVITSGTYGCPKSDITTDNSGNVWSKTTNICDSYGHATTVNRWTGPSNYLTTVNQYYSTGLLHTTTDPNNNLTTYTYGVCNNAFPTNINVAGLSTTMDWNCIGEVPISSTDPNNQETNYYYVNGGMADPFWRLQQTVYADSGQVTTTYNLAMSTPNITTSQIIDGSRTLTTQTNFDSLGRPIEKQITSDQNIDYVDTTYDSLGRVASVSNPYQSTTDASYGLTQYVYDALGRTTSAEHLPDGTVQTWTYSGNVTIFKNELSNQWQQTSDALGRLTSVLEPNGSGSSPSMTTSYAYYPLGNLQSVTQSGASGADTPRVTRTYTYDELSRLTSSFNPESGTVTYVYDGNGNVTQKTSAPLNGASANQVVGYCYDAWNHLVGKWGAAPPSGCNATPTTITSTLLAAYTYGVAGGSTGTAGRLTDEKAYLNSTLVAERAPTLYDPMGRLRNENQTPYSPSATSYTLSNTWNSGGDLVTSTNSVSGITLTYSPDSVNRLGNVTSSMSAYAGLSFPTALYSVSSYGAAGMTHSTFAGDPNTAGLFEQYRHYDTHGRVADNEIVPDTDTFGTGTVMIAGGPVTSDTGSVSVAAGVTETVPFGPQSTVQTIGNALAAAFNQNSGSAVSVTVNESGPPNSPCQNGNTTTTPNMPCVVLQLTAIEPSSYGDLALSSIETDANSSSPSFAVTASGTTLVGGSGDSPQNRNINVYTLSYDRAGNVSESTDPYSGGWFYGYDSLNRLAISKYTNYQGFGVYTPAGVATFQCWSYDGFGNRLFEADELASNNPTACPTSLTTANSTHWATYTTSNKIAATDTMPSGPSYDAAGNVIQDALNKYVYDAEGRLCAVMNTASDTAVQYIYDAEGRRVAKGTLTSWPSTGNVCAAPTAANGFALASSHLRGVTGTEDVEVWNGTGVWRQNVFANGQLLASYNFSNSGSTPLSLSFAFNDWLGTKRAEANASGQLVNWWNSDPFGNYLTPYNASADPSEQHFTGKERDSESGNDYFGARYYASTSGRFMSPDPAEDIVASVDNPQSWNAYSYVLGNPLINVDPTGTDCTVVIGGITQSPNTPGTTAQQQFANGAGAISAFPYAGGSVAQGADEVQGQVHGATPATAVAVNALQAAAQTPGPINVVTFSGGAQAFSTAIQALPDIAARINNVTYLSPGMGIGSSPLFTGNGSTMALYGQGLVDGAATSQNLGILNTLNGVLRGNTGCAHDANCAFSKNAALLKRRSGAPCTANTIKTFYRGQTLIGPGLGLSALDSLRLPGDQDSGGYSTATIIY